MKLGDELTITQVYRRRTRYDSIPNVRRKVWEACPIKERRAIFLGYRTLADGIREWEDEVGGIFIPQRHFPAMLVCFSTKENPVYAPLPEVAP